MKHLLVSLLLLAACGDDGASSVPADATPTEPDSAPGDDSMPPQPVAPTQHKSITTFADTCVSAPTTFGVYGDVTAYDRFEITNPDYVGPSPLPVQVLVPTGGAATHPVIFYNHPFGGTDWSRNSNFLEFLVSHDYIVIYTPYATTTATVCERYDTLWGGEQAAVAALATQTGMDLTKVGIIGHSFGGGASPWIAKQVLAKGWGTAGSFVFSIAPWYTYRMDAASDWQALSTSRYLLMAFADDETNDPRIAIEGQWNHDVGPREYLLLPSGTDGQSCSQTADHTVPNNSTLNGLDTWGTWRHAQALAACTLRGMAAGCALVDGATTSEEAMGTWLSTNAAVPVATGTDDPGSTVGTGTYTFTQDAHDNYPCDGTASLR